MTTPVGMRSGPSPALDQPSREPAAFALRPAANGRGLSPSRAVQNAPRTLETLRSTTANASRFAEALNGTIGGLIAKPGFTRGKFPNGATITRRNSMVLITHPRHKGVTVSYDSNDNSLRFWDTSGEEPIQLKEDAARPAIEALKATAIQATEDPRSFAEF
jgi:hypothetical protein